LTHASRKPRRLEKSGGPRPSNKNEAQTNEKGTQAKGGSARKVPNPVQRGERVLGAVRTSVQPSLVKGIRTRIRGCGKVEASRSERIGPGGPLSNGGKGERDVKANPHGDCTNNNHGADGPSTNEGLLGGAFN